MHDCNIQSKAVKVGSSIRTNTGLHHLMVLVGTDVHGHSFVTSWSCQACFFVNIGSTLSKSYNKGRFYSNLSTLKSSFEKVRALLNGMQI